MVTRNTNKERTAQTVIRGCSDDCVMAVLLLLVMVVVMMVAM